MENEKNIDQDYRKYPLTRDEVYTVSNADDFNERVAKALGGSITKNELSNPEKLSLIESLVDLSGQMFMDECSGTERYLMSIEDRKSIAKRVIRLTDELLSENMDQFGL